MLIEDIAEAVARLQYRLDRLDRLEAGIVELAVAVARLTDDDSAHHSCMIVRKCTSPFERQLIVRVRLASPGFVAAEQPTLGGSDNDLVGGMGAAASKDRALHGSENVRFVSAGL